MTRVQAARAPLKRCLLALAAVVASCATTVRAAGWALGEQSAVAGGTGGAGTARAGHASAAWYNPAALADGGGLQLAAGLLLAAPTVEATARDGAWAERTDGGLKTPPHLYASYALGPFAAGLAANVPFGSGVSWPRSWPGRHESVLSSVTVYRIAPFVGWRFGPVRVAAGPHVDIALLRIERRLDFVDTEGDLAIELDGAAAGGHASLFVELLDGRLAFGASYKSRTRPALDGTARFDVPDAFATKAHDQTASTALTLPDLLAFGARFETRLHWPLELLVDVGATFWSTLDRFTVDFNDEATTDAELTPRWKTRPFVRAGVAVSPLRRLVVRAGLLYDPSPAPAETLAPNSPDSHRLGVTVGAGVHLIAGIHLDAFYGYVRLLGNESSAPEALAASYEGRIHMFGFGLRYR